MFDYNQMILYATKIQQYSSRQIHGLESGKISKYTLKLRKLIEEASEATLVKSNNRALEHHNIIKGKIFS